MIRRSFFIDENLNTGLAQTLPAIFRHHRFRSAHQTGCCGLPDIELFQAVATLGFDAILTFDFAQLEDTKPGGERETLRANGVHWIGVPTSDAKGDAQLALLTAVASAGLHHVIGDWGNDPTAYYLSGPDRLLLTAPKTDLL